MMQTKTTALGSLAARSTLTYNDWCNQGRLTVDISSLALVLDTELVTITLIRLFNKINFRLYREALSELICYFVNNNKNNNNN